MQYSEIVDMALSESDRSDNLEVTTHIDNMLKLVEAKMNRVLIAQKMSSIITVPCVSLQQVYSLPADYLSLKDIYNQDAVLRTGKQEYSYTSPEQIANASTNNALGSYYTLVNNALQIWPPLDNTRSLVLTYYSRIVPLTSTNTTNWMSLLNPDCYVFGLVMEICAFVKSFDAAMAWKTRFEEVLGDIDLQDAKSTWSGPALTTKRG
jgi:hypothetical protein